MCVSTPRGDSFSASAVVLLSLQTGSQLHTVALWHISHSSKWGDYLRTGRKQAWLLKGMGSIICYGKTKWKQWGNMGYRKISSQVMLPDQYEACQRDLTILMNEWMSKWCISLLQYIQTIIPVILPAHVIHCVSFLELTAKTHNVDQGFFCEWFCDISWKTSTNQCSPFWAGSRKCQAQLCPLPPCCKVCNWWALRTQ